MVLWMASIAASVALLVVTAALALTVPAFATVHLLVAGLVTSAIALVALREARELSSADAPRGLVLADLTRHMGLLWAWAALVLAATYGTAIFTWAGWLQAFVVLMVFSGLTLFLSRILRDDHAAGRNDERLSRLAGALAVVTLVAVVGAAGGIGFSRLAGYQPADPGAWVAEHVIVFGGIAMAVVAGFLLKTAAGATEQPPSRVGGTGQIAR